MKNISEKYIIGQLGEYEISLALVLGSGLNDLVDSIDIILSIPYSEIPGFPQSTVPGHDGSFILGTYKGVTILAAKGRFHYYEGYSMDELLTLVDVFNMLNISHIIVTNAAGLMNPDYKPGDILMIKNGLDTTHILSGEDMAFAAISPKESALIQKAADSSGVKIGSGIYVWTTGPSYETPEEIKYYSSLGGDLVGMSTLPEIIHARKAKMNVYPFSCATNWAAGISENPLTHEEVTETADRVKHDLSSFILTLCKTIGDA